MMRLNVDWDSSIADIGPALYRFFRVRFDPSQADDLVQETLIRLMDKVRAGQFDPELGSLRMYAFGIARFVKLEGRRGLQRAELPLEAPAVSLPPDEALSAEQQRARLHKALQSLSEIQQQVLGLYMDDELSLTEIGQILAMPAATVRSHLHRAKENLKTLLGVIKEVSHE